MNKFIHFIKYNNAVVIILLAFFIVGSATFAATETGQQVIGQQTTSVQGVDNTLLLTANPDAMEMNFKIEKIEQDVDYYYVTYTFLNLVKIDNAWQYQLTEKSRKVTKKIRQDLGAYLAEEFKQEHDAIVKDLRAEQVKASLEGEQVREEVTEYTGLIGQTLDVVASVFPNYEPVKTVAVESPEVPAEVLAAINSATTTVPVSADNLTAVYDSYILESDPDHDNVFGLADNCMLTYNPDQKDTDADGLGDVCDIDQMAGETATTTASSTDEVTSTEPGTITEAAPAEPAPITEDAPEILPDIVIPAETTDQAAPL
jgi:PBP1b-binding outer membrane lipoprotein LpoB